MKQLLFISTCISIVFCNQIKSQNSLSVNVSNDVVMPKHYIVTKTTNDIIIDGKADETSWKNAKFTDKFIDIEDELTKENTYEPDDNSPSPF